MTRVVVISDIHFGKLARSKDFSVPGEFTKDNTSGNMPLYEGLKLLIKEMKPQYFLVAGDITSSADSQEFYYCEKKILELAEFVDVRRENIICCTGNHDVDWKISELYRKKELDTEDENDINNDRKNKYQEIAAHVPIICMKGLYNEKMNGPAPFSGIVEGADFVIFVLNTGWKCGPYQKYSHGELSSAQLRWFEETLKQFNFDHRKKIVLMHHHPFNYPYPSIGEDISQIIEGAEFCEIAERNGIDIVIHGHRHHPKVKTLHTSGLSPISYFCAGSLSVNAEHRSNGEIPNTVHFIDVDKNLDYFVLHNFSFTDAEGWKKTENRKETPLDAVMKIGRVSDLEACKEKIKNYKKIEDDYIKLDWEKMDEELQFLTCDEVMDLMKTELSDTHEIIGKFPDSIMLFRKGTV